MQLGISSGAGWQPFLVSFKLMSHAAHIAIFCPLSHLWTTVSTRFTSQILHEKMKLVSFYCIDVVRLSV